MDFDSKPSWADQVEEEGDEGPLPSPKELIKGNIKTIIEYKIDEDGKKLKIIRTFRIETRKASKAVARRKNWKKFGTSEYDPPGPNVATTTVSDDVYMTFITSKEDLNNTEEDDPMSKLKGQKIVSCRICKGDHWTTRCPYKDTLGPMQKELAEQLGLTTAEKEKGSEPEPAQPAQSKTGKYVPPSLRDGANRRGESMQTNRRALTSQAVTCCVDAAVFPVPQRMTMPQSVSLTFQRTHEKLTCRNCSGPLVPFLESTWLRTRTLASPRVLPLLVSIVVRMLPEPLLGFQALVTIT
ncbi:eukaryotic translation initiation factor 3 subunit G isoform X3 [Carcharodon carcharias]|uniref:eukaryotic translation initiation factor 3 subunit G isoform X3 n=1 Tax=Carcharodon carcharias TaxID=13397 RepID=UPI001B7DA5F6|nr:eukaryotic translation initiation factor 3 subunit G isoform X3 [Carcharodon carcharias]